MTKYDDIYEYAVEHYGLISSAQAKEIGVTNNELVQYAKRGKVNRVGQGLYKLARYVPTSFDAYAEAVALVGPDAFLFGESVIAMHGLAPTNPTFLQVASSKRVRKTLPSYIKLIQMDADASWTSYEGVPSQSVADAIRSCRGKIMDDRLRDATKNARKQGLITQLEERELLEELE